MKILQQKYTMENGWETLRGAGAISANLVLIFGSNKLLKNNDLYGEICSAYAGAEILIASTAGEIFDTQVNEDSLSLTAIEFTTSSIRTTSTQINNSNDSFKAGYRIANALSHKGLKNVFVISDGQIVNGSDLVAGIQEFLPKGVILTGGLAGDGIQFKNTLVGLNEPPSEGQIAAIGFYGDNLQITYGSVGGWDPFGVERLITKSEGNVLFELDGKPALDIYKAYLGEYVKELPGSALFFPLSIRVSETEPAIVRTILNVNETDKSLVFAGNVPKGSYAQLMKANLDRLIEGASIAAVHSQNDIMMPDLAILISCVGRRLVLDQRVEEEIEVIRAVYGNKTAITGFYSYGEISSTFNFNKCELHNQTMTITTLTER